MSLLQLPGDLSTTPLAAVLLEALNVRATGVLEVAHGGGTSRLWFRDGRPVGAQVFTGFRPLGHMLLQAGLIDIEALSRSLALMAESRRPQGEILVEMGAVSREAVDRALAEQQEGYFGLIAALEAGGFAFEASVPVPEWTRGSRLSPLRTIVDALERPQAGALVVSALQPVAAGGVRIASGYAEVADAFRWTDAEAVLVRRLARRCTLEAFFEPSEVPPERARAVLAALLLLGLAVSVAERPVARGDTIAGETIVGLGLGAEGRATAAPPAPAAPAASPPASAGRRSDPAEARARRQRLLQQAMRNMGVGPFTGRAPPPTTPAPGAEPPPPPPPRDVPGSAERQLREALLAVKPRARERDLFARLGLARGASRDDVKKAFLQIAKQFHPDRFAAPALADLQEEVRDFFAAVNEAYEVLSDDKKRAAWLAKSPGGGGDPAGARLDFQKGEACLRTRDHARARGFFESAVRADPRPDYQAALAFACLADPARKDLARARELLDQATRDPKCDRAFFVAGILARDEKDIGGAERMFRAAVQANPRNADAVRELRAIEARRSDKRDR
jgi:tetratricopeptide (TPR) repeat protein